MVKGKNPIRIVLDCHLKMSLMSSVLNAAAETIVVTSLEADEVKAEAISALPNVEVICLPLEDGKIPLDLLIIQLANRNITSLLVEGGSEIHGAFKDAGLADRVYAFIAPKVVGGKNALTPIGGTGSATIDEGWQLDEVEYQVLGKDLLITGKIKEA